MDSIDEQILIEQVEATAKRSKQRVQDLDGHDVLGNFIRLNHLPSLFRFKFQLIFTINHSPNFLSSIFLCI